MKISFDFTTGQLIGRLSNLHQRRLNAVLASDDLTYSQFVVLAGINKILATKDEITQIMLVDFTKFDKSTISSVLKTLIKKNLVSRKENPADTRSKILNLTPQGKTLIEKAKAKALQSDKELFNENEIDIEKFNEFLMKILQSNERR